MKDKFDLLVFDWDGTLINSIDWIVECIQHAAQACAMPVPHELEAKNLIGLSLEGLMQNLYPQADHEKIRQLCMSYSQKYGAWQIMPDDLFEGVLETLYQLRDAGYQLAVATGKSRRGLDAALKGTGTEALFLSTRCADETASKPDPLMLTQIIDQVGASHERTLMIGDSAHDMEMAANAGIAALAVSCGVHGTETLSRYEPLHCLQQTTEILKLL